ncbi:MAG: ankyrin repeat domain-containing protein [Alphaproteobacteria bacterium]|nr:ankyrin repeat domain-containing protein [Alphaproteobacteria bacterium]
MDAPKLERERLYSNILAGNVTAVRTTLKAGFDVTSQDANGLTPLHYAATRCTDEPIPSLLIQFGANPNALDRSLRTPLHLAVIFRNASVVRLLVANGANVNAVDDTGMTPYDYGNDDIRNFLRHPDTSMGPAPRREEGSHLPNRGR